MDFKEKFTKYLTLESSESGLSETQIEYITEMANSLFNQEKQLIDLNHDLNCRLENYHQMIGRTERVGDAYRDIGRRLSKINTSYLE